MFNAIAVTSIPKLNFARATGRLAKTRFDTELSRRFGESCGPRPGHYWISKVRHLRRYLRGGASWSKCSPRRIAETGPQKVYTAADKHIRWLETICPLAGAVYEHGLL